MKIVYLILFLLVIAGCTGSFTSQTGTVPASEIQNTYRTGWQGVVLQTMRNLPPQEIFTDSNFMIGIEAHNRGAYDIDNGLIVLVYDEDYVQLHQKSIGFSLEGKNPFFQRGETKQFFVDGQTKSLGSESVQRSLPFYIFACYPYEAILVETICLDVSYETNQFSGQSTCTFRQGNSFSGQGGPVGISATSYTVTEDRQTLSGRFIVDITLRHSGRGSVVDAPSFYSACTQGITQDMADRVKIREVALSDVTLNCNRDEVVLRNNQATIQCSVDGLPAHLFPYNAPLRIELEYGYVETLNTNVLLKRG